MAQALQTNSNQKCEGNVSKPPGDSLPPMSAMPVDRTVAKEHTSSPHISFSSKKDLFFLLSVSATPYSPLAYSPRSEPEFATFRPVPARRRRSRLAPLQLWMGRPRVSLADRPQMVLIRYSRVMRRPRTARGLPPRADGLAARDQRDLKKNERLSRATIVKFTDECWFREKFAAA